MVTVLDIHNKSQNQNASLISTKTALLFSHRHYLFVSFTWYETFVLAVCVWSWRDEQGKPKEKIHKMHELLILILIAKDDSYKGIQNHDMPLVTKVSNLGFTISLTLIILLDIVRGQWFGQASLTFNEASKSNEGRSPVNCRIVYDSF